MKYAWLFILPLFAFVMIVAYSIYRFRTKQRKTKKAVMVAHSKRVKILPEYEKVRKKYRLLLFWLQFFRHIYNIDYDFCIAASFGRYN